MLQTDFIKEDFRLAVHVTASGSISTWQYKRLDNNLSNLPDFFPLDFLFVIIFCITEEFQQWYVKVIKTKLQNT